MDDVDIPRRSARRFCDRQPARDRARLHGRLPAPDMKTAGAGSFHGPAGPITHEIFRGSMKIDHPLPLGTLLVFGDQKWAIRSFDVRLAKAPSGSPVLSWVYDVEADGGGISVS